MAPTDKSLTIIRDDGILSVANVRSEVCPIYVRSIPESRARQALERRVNNWRTLLRIPGHETEWHIWRKYPMARRTFAHLVSENKPVDFCRGPAAMVDAFKHKRRCRLSPELGGHISELIERLQYPERFVGQFEVASAFEPIEPLPCWQ